MSLKRRFFTVITLSVAAIGFTVTASAQEAATTPKEGVGKHDKMKRGGFGKGMRGGRHGGFQGLRGIELTDAQKEQVRQIHESNKPDAATMQEMKAIHEARKAGTEITAEQKERMKALREQSRAKREAVHQQVLAILTPEQRQQVETQKAERQKRMEERRELRKQRKTVGETKPTDN